MKNYKILITSTSFQDTPGKHHNLLKIQPWDIEFMRGPLSEDMLLPIINKFDAVICGDDEYTRKVIEIGKKGKLKVLSKYGVGLDRIDLKAAKDFEIRVKNVPGINQVSVSEHVLALLFSFEKNIYNQYNSVQNGSWKRSIGHEIEGKNIGIIGLGAVGKELSKKASALGLNVYAFDLFKNEEFLNNNKHIKFVENIDELYEVSDIISLHIPHTESTNEIINKNVIENKLKRSPIIINTARGKLVNSIDIIEGLRSEKIRGYLCDVLENEPIKNDEKLIGIENVIITPHVASRTYQNVQKQGVKSIENLIIELNKSL